MRFLLDANLPRRSGSALIALGHECLDVRNLNMGGAADSVIATYARDNSLALVTRDFDFADVRNYPPAQYSGIVVLELPDDANSDSIVNLLTSFAMDQPVLNLLPGRLAIVQPGRIRLRPK